LRLAGMNSLDKSHLQSADSNWNAYLTIMKVVWGIRFSWYFETVTSRDMQ
jgi:hypothetical protein